MSDMIEVKTAELTGPALDWAVAKAKGLPYEPNYIRVSGPRQGKTWDSWSISNFRPSTDWSQGGPLIENANMTIERSPRTRGCAVIGFEDWRAIHPKNYGGLIRHTGYGGTALVAACRAIVAANLGETVSIPAELK